MKKPKTEEIWQPAILKLGSEITVSGHPGVVKKIRKSGIFVAVKGHEIFVDRKYVEDSLFPKDKVANGQRS